MASDTRYYLTALPSLGDLGSAPPLTPAQYLDLVAEAKGPPPLLQTIFLFDDLHLREAVLAGEIESAQPAVLSVRQVRNEEPLPEFLTIETPVARAVDADRLWEAYFRHAAATAAAGPSPLLRQWVGFEIALRNAVAAARAAQLGLEASDYLIAADLADRDTDLSAVLGEWQAAATPLDGLHVLLRARWAWLAERDAWFTFSDDEFVAYGLRLLLLAQWYRVAHPEAAPAARAAKETSDLLERIAQ